MKKSLIVTLALVFVLGIVGTAFAATNPFVDVPAKHWAYGSITQLANAGIIDGYGDGTFRGDQLMTRYEMAQIVAKAMAKSDKANAEQKAAIDKLAVEFAAELNNLGVRVSKLEANASTIKFTGDARIRYQENWGLTDAGAQRIQERIRLNMASNLNDKVVFNGTLLMQNTTNSHDETTVYGSSSSDQTELSIAQFTFKNVADRADLVIGRQILNQGATTLVAGTSGYYDSVKLTFGNVLSGWVAYGDASAAPGPNGETAKNDADLLTAQLKWAPSKVTTIYAFTQLGKNIVAADYSLYGAGLSTKWGNFTIAGDYAKNNDADDYDTAWYASVWYKGADKAKAGSYGIFVDYRNIEAYSLAANSPTGASLLSGLNIANNDSKGFGYGFNYTIAKNVVFTGDVEVLESSAFGTDHDNVYYFRTEFWF